MTNRRHRRSSKKKHDVPLTEEMLNELNKSSMGGYGHGMTSHPHAMAYDNYGQDPDEFYDLDDVWNNDKYNYGQHRYKVRIFWFLNEGIMKPSSKMNIVFMFSISLSLQRQSNMSSSTSGGGNYSKSTPSPYQSQLYDSWKTEWNAPTYGYDQQYRAGPSGGGSSGGEDSRHYGRGSYMTKGGRRMSYDDDF